MKELKITELALTNNHSLIANKDILYVYLKKPPKCDIETSQNCHYHVENGVLKGMLR